ncbi:MAG: hypothetical protein M3014_08690 [Chloroflexota bacterium]|nr:hypothetical protein [Chloroflexota bacterium]
MSEAEQQPDQYQVADLAASRRKSLRFHLLVLGGYALLTLLLTYPLALRLTTEIPGGGDAWHNIWNLWWVHEALAVRHINPFQTDMLFYPAGANLYLHTLTFSAGLIALPLQVLGVTLITCYNIVLLLTFILAGYGAYLLCRYLTGSRWASFVGGGIFAFSPYHFAHLLGHMNLASLQWIPFYVLLLLRAADIPGSPPLEAQSYRHGQPMHDEVTGANRLGGSSPSKMGIANAAGAGALLAVNAYTDLLYTVFLALFTFLFLFWRFVVPSERRYSVRNGVGLQQAALRMLVGGAVFVLIASPLLVPALAEAQQPYAQQSLNETLIYSSDAMLAFTPSELHPIWGHAVSHRIGTFGTYLAQKGPSERVVFLGYTVLALALYAARKLRANRYVPFWLFTAAATWLLSLGPQLQLFGKGTLPLIHVAIPLPYALLNKLPLFAIARTPSRLTVLTMLSLSVLASIAMTYLIGQARTRTQGFPVKARRRLFAISAGLPLLILFEFLALPFPTVPPGWDVPIYSRIAAEPGRFALLELPIRPVGDYMAYQTIHNKPIIGGFLARQPPYPLLNHTPTLNYLLDTTDAASPVKQEVTGGTGLAALRRLNVKYVIIHWWLLTAAQKKQMEAKLAALLGRPADWSYPDNQVAAWQLFP